MHCVGDRQLLRLVLLPAPAIFILWRLAMLTPKKAIFSILSLGLGIFLLGLVLKLTGIGMPEVVESLRQLNPFYAFMVLVTTWLHLWLSAYKWKVISRKVAGEDAGNRDFYMPYITFGAMLGQLVPQQLSMMAVQSFAMKFHGLSSLRKSVFAVFYDQVFNLIVPVLVIPPALLLAINQISEPIALFLTLMTLFIVPFLIRGWSQPAILAFVKFYIAVKQRLFRQQPAVDLHTFFYNAPVFKSRFTLWLFWLAIFRYGNMILRSLFIVMAGGFQIGSWAIVFTNPLVYLSMIVGFTPANLGLMEWTWIGSLQLFGVSSTVAANYAIVQRILFFVGTVAIGLFYAGLVVIPKLFVQPKPNEETSQL